MRNKCTALVLVVLLLAACKPIQESPTPLPTSWPPQPASNFAFSLAFGACTTDVLDMFEQTYRRQIDVEEYVTVSVTLTDAQMENVYHEVAAIDFFSYPETFRIPVQEGETYMVITPAPTYILTVRNGGLTKTVTWTDEIKEPTSPEADRLRGLIQLILQMVETHPAIRQLPKSRLACL